MQIKKLRYHISKIDINIRIKIIVKIKEKTQRYIKLKANWEMNHNKISI